jgi:DNA-3-methyladenine glycosylase II
MKEAYATLLSDPIMKRVIKNTGRFDAPGKYDPYRSLLHSIISQQLSTKAADTISGRFLQLFPRNNPRPELVRDIDIQLLRSAGLSGQKSGYMKNVAEFALEGNLKKTLLEKMDDEDLVQHLITVKGVGIWTAEILAMFALARTDIFPVDDLGIRNTIAELYNLKTSGKLFNNKAIKIADRWRPYRSVACRHLWRWKDEG